MPRTLIMTDSTCDLPAEWVRRLDVRVVPTYVHFDQDSLADDGIQLTRPEFYQRLAQSSILPTTAAPPVGQVIDVMDRALHDADHVVAITAAAGLSGIFNTFRLAAEQTDPQRVTLIDSQMTSMGMGWQAVIAAERAQRGQSPAEIEAAVLAVRPRADIWAALDTVEYLRRSGRVSWAAAMIGGLFNIKPVIRLHDSVVSSVARVRTSQRAFDTLVELAVQAAPLERLAILHTRNSEGAERLAAALTEITPPAEVVIVEVTPVIGVHVGPRGLGLGIVRAERNRT
jgi:DegV family protein with EDD domain